MIPISNALRANIAENVALESDPVEKTFQVYDTNTFLSNGFVHAFLEKDNPQLDNGTYILGTSEASSREGSVIQGWTSYPREYHADWPEEPEPGQGRKEMKCITLPWAYIKQLHSQLAAYLGTRPDKKYQPGIRLKITRTPGQKDNYIDIIAEATGNPKPESTSNCGGFSHTYSMFNAQEHNLYYYFEAQHLMQALSFFVPLRVKNIDQFVEMYYLNPTNSLSVHPLLFNMNYNGHQVLTALQVEKKNILHTNTSDGQKGMLPGIAEFTRPSITKIKERGGKKKNIEVDQDKYDEPEPETEE